MGVIDPARTKWAAPIMFNAKKDGSLRFWANYERLNAVTVCNSYRIPKMDECIDSLSDALIFFTLDKNHSYRQIKIN